MLEINKIYCGDHLKVIKDIDNESVNLTITSPPYDDLRDYNSYSFDYKKLFKELYRVTAMGGVVVWIVGDSIIEGSESGTSFRQALYAKYVGFRLHDTMIYEKNGTSFPAHNKSVRYSQIFEYMFIFSRGKPQAINLIKDKKNRYVGSTNSNVTNRKKDGNLIKQKSYITSMFGYRNNVWKINSGYQKSTKDKIAYDHPAIFPEKLVYDHIITWSNRGDLILDPMCGSGTTCKMAVIAERNYIGIEVSKDYCKIAEERIKNMPNSLF